MHIRYLLQLFVHYDFTFNFITLLFFIIKGSCIGIVVAIGANTVVGKLIDKKQWPPPGV